MSEILKKFKGIKLNKKSLYLILGVVLALILLFAGEMGGSTSEREASVTDTATYSAEYIKKTEKELEAMLSEISGAGDVKVMITLESCYENVYAKAYNSEQEQNEKSTEEVLEEEYVILKNGSSNEECLVIKVYEPKIKGVAVVCRGGDNVSVKKAITETVCALFDISSAKVSVTKMNNR